MELDLHFYGVYALARAAGVEPATAKTIACSSQFVDDAMEDGMIELDNQTAIFPTRTSHKLTDYRNTLAGDQWKVWIPFHYLPGGESEKGALIEKLVCRKNSKPAREILNHALDNKGKSYGPHLAGIAAHAYADTFTHYGFIGLSRKMNRVIGSSIVTYVQSHYMRSSILKKAEMLKRRLRSFVTGFVPVGHLSVSTFPDLPYLQWEYRYEETGEQVARNNVRDFAEACKGLYTFFSKFARKNESHREPQIKIPWDTIHEKIRDILRIEETLERRIELWKEKICSSALFTSTEQDRHLEYSEYAWRPAGIIDYYTKSGNVNGCQGLLFYQAASGYRKYVTEHILPGMGIRYFL